MLLEAVNFSFSKLQLERLVEYLVLHEITMGTSIL
jgi:hypothetical protein